MRVSLEVQSERPVKPTRADVTGFWGSLNKHLNYDAYYLAGSGYDLAFKGQRGLGAARSIRCTVWERRR